MHKCLFDLFLSLEIYNLLLNLAPHVDERCFFFYFFVITDTKMMRGKCYDDLWSGCWSGKSQV